MDLIRELKDVRFQMGMRGYDCDAVDVFLAKIRGEVAELQSQKERALERIASLESQTSDGESDAEGTLRRTLVLAQRLADETVADAKQTAETMVESAAQEASKTREAAQSEADSLLASANEEAAEARETGRQELERAREDAARTSEEVARETLAERETARLEAERILSEAEEAGQARVKALEEVAREEVARSREPIREEIRQLEATRESLLGDIDALEEHLTEQRTRVRTAVEALRAGMSGSIDDLERVATDDDAMTPTPKPDLSGATGSSVPAAPDIDVAEAVNQAAEPSPTVSELADKASAEVAAERPADADAHAPADDAIVDDEGWTDHSIVDDSDEVDEIEDAEVVDDAGPATEPIPVVILDDLEEPGDGATMTVGGDSAAAGEDTRSGEEADGDVVDLDAAPSVLFGTDVSEDAEVVDANSTEFEGEILDVEPAQRVDDQQSFLGRFAEAIGDLPIRGR